MSTTVNPSKIETKLDEIWSDLQRTGQTRACLFNLILFSPLGKRTDYIRAISQKVLEKFPCRILFISEDRENDGIKTAVSVIPQDQSEHAVVCDFIDICIGTQSLERAGSLVLPHILPDLPIYLLWADQIDLENPLYKRIKDYNTRTIFDSESSQDFQFFAKTLLDLKTDVADLNWGRVEPWKNLFVLNFHPNLYLQDLKNSDKITIQYNGYQTDCFSQAKIQALYFHAWLADRLNWQFVESDKSTLTYKKEDGKKVVFFLENLSNKELKPATIISIKVSSSEEKLFEYVRSSENPNQIIFHATSKTACELPTNFWIENPHEGQSLVKEIYHKGTSKHFLSMLKKLVQLPKESLC